ncbi:MAG TPA: hypothetical protein PLJ27_09345, partial [Polyangiaceae bacterium]|nr:hypothetical protein [Polyangiaceae bacterium]
MSKLRWYGCLGVGLFMVACGANETDSLRNTAPYPNDTGGSGGYEGPAGGGQAGSGQLPPEQEVESAYESPVATGRFVWIANPLSGRVAFIDAVTLEVSTTEAGNGPSYLAPVPHPSEDVAVVINEVSSDATVLRATASDTIDSISLPIAQQNNAWAISSTGRWAIAWTDSRKIAEANETHGFQDIAVLDLSEGAEKATRLSVGYRPVALQFSADEMHAYAVTQDGISVMDLSTGNPVIVGLIPVSDDPFDDPASRDVSITADGMYALVRWENSDRIVVVSLENGMRTEVNLSGTVTDLDLSSDGKKAIAVIREQGEVAVLPIPGIVEAPTAYETVKITNMVVGSATMASEAQVALLYSNASQQDRIAALHYENSPATSDAIKLHAPVLAAFLAPTGISSIVLHPPTNSLESSYVSAFSVLHLSPKLPAKIVGMTAPPSAVAISPSGEYGVVAERDDAKKVFGAYLIKMFNQQVDRFELASPPIAVGTLAEAKRAYVAQKHPEGRITFVDLETGLIRTL